MASGYIKKITDLMYKDKGINGSAQRLSQLVWLLFLKVFDFKEEEAELENDYVPKIPEGYRWRDWANPDNVKDAKTGDDLINFVNNELLIVLRGLPIKETINGETKEAVKFDKNDPQSLMVKSFMEDTINYMKDGTLLRMCIDELNTVDFSDAGEQHEFNDVYEEMLKDLQAAKGEGGEFYSGRALTRLITDYLDPKPGDKVADFACGTGGFLVDALNCMESKLRPGDVKGQKKIHESIIGIEYKPLPYMLCVTNLLLHGIELPKIEYRSAFTDKYSDLSKDDEVDIIAMNPPYGGTVTEADKSSFPTEFRTAESYGLFMAMVIKRLKKNGKCGIILPDGFLFTDNDAALVNVKAKLFKECNVHTIIRMPQSCFAPYTSIATNLVFFDKTGPTSETWFYRFDLPEGKKFSKTKNPLTRDKITDIDKWWNGRKELFEELENGGISWKSKKYSMSDIVSLNYNIDLCGYPVEEKVILSPEETIRNFVKKRESLDNQMDEKLAEIMSLLGVKE